MIPAAAITHWRNVAPWPQDAQVEQDLILCRALVEIFTIEELSGALLLRGGTALHKLFVQGPKRYSEDIDLVQAAPGPIGPILNALRSKLDPYLGTPQYDHNPNIVTLRYRMESEIEPVVRLRLKLEINTREHFVVYSVLNKPFEVTSPWFTGSSEIKTFSLDELLATKLRALYQRRKGRDLFDLGLGLEMSGVDPARIVAAFRRYLEAQGRSISRREFEVNLAEKLETPAFQGDLTPLLAPSVNYDPHRAAALVTERLLAIL